MGSLLKVKLLNKSKQEVDGESALKNNLILVYFSAHWCGPCRMFTPKLKKFYEKAKAAGHNVEIVFISSDHSEKEMWSYFTEEHGDYLTLPYANRALKEELNKKYDVKGIPWLVVTNKNGDAVVNEADEHLGDGENIDLCRQWWELVNK